jgi:N-acyl-L-homoserine lactone synthetase
MLHILQSDAAPVSDGTLRAMFAARKSVFVDLLGWDVPVIDGRYEVDQFDDAHATYLILTDERAEHLASARLLPTMRPHLLDSFYPMLCEDGPPRAHDAAEITRFCLDRRLDARRRRAARDALVCGLVEHALQHGIRAYSAIAEMAWFQQILAFGWRCRPLGMPRVIDGTMLAALRIDVDAHAPSLLAAAGIISVPPAAEERRVAA